MNNGDMDMTRNHARRIVKSYKHLLEKNHDLTFPAGSDGGSIQIRRDGKYVMFEYYEDPLDNGSYYIFKIF